MRWRCFWRVGVLEMEVEVDLELGLDFECVFGGVGVCFAGRTGEDAILGSTMVELSTGWFVA